MRGRPFAEPFTSPPGLGVRQPSAAFAGFTTPKAAEGCRTPRRSRDAARRPRFVPLTSLRYLYCLLFTFAVTLPASAHIQQGEAAGFVTGLRHPWSGLDHILAMVAVGIWGAQLRAPAIWLLPVTFPMVMALGGFLGLIGVHLPGVEFGIAASALLLGVAVSVEARPQLIWAALLVGVFGLYHGHAHGTELPPGQSGMLYSMGFVIATGCLHALGIALGLLHPLPAGRWALRGAGAFIAVMGLLFLWRAFS